MNHTTFSMQNILNEPIQPGLCRRILQQIKSPLLQQSFAVTNDQSLNNSYVNAPKRPNIPPPTYNEYQTRRPAIKNKYNTYSNGQSFYPAQSRYYQKASYTQNKNFLDGVTNRFESQIMQYNTAELPNFNTSQFKCQSVVSPLDPTITLKQHNNQQLDSGLWGYLCGEVFNTKLQTGHQIQCQPGKSKYQRKRIFDQKSKSILQTKKVGRFAQKRIQSILLLPQEKSHISIQQNQAQKIVEKTLKQVTQQLQKNNYPQMAEFIQLTTLIVQQLKKAQAQRKYLLQNIQMVYQFLPASSKSLDELFENQQNYQKFLNRMNFLSINDMIKKITRGKLMKTNNYDPKQFNSSKNKVAETLQSMMECFSSIQKLLDEFLQSNRAIQKLKKVYSILDQKFKKSQTKNTLNQLMNVFQDVRLFDCQKDLYHLEYIWDNLSERILSEEQFISSFVRSNAIYRDEEFSHQHSEFQSQLSKMGFIKN